MGAGVVQVAARCGPPRREQPGADVGYPTVIPATAVELASEIAGSLDCFPAIASGDLKCLPPLITKGTGFITGRVWGWHDHEIVVGADCPPDDCPPDECEAAAAMLREKAALAGSLGYATDGLKGADGELVDCTLGESNQRLGCCECLRELAEEFAKFLTGRISLADFAAWWFSFAGPISVGCA